MWPIPDNNYNEYQWRFEVKPVYLSAVWHKSVHESVTVTEESVKLWRGLNRRRCSGWNCCHFTATDLQPGDSIRWTWARTWNYPTHLFNSSLAHCGEIMFPFKLFKQYNSVCVIHLFSPSVFHLCVEIFICSSTCLSQSSEHMTISCRARQTRTRSNRAFRNSV